MFSTQCGRMRSDRLASAPPPYNKKHTRRLFMRTPENPNSTNYVFVGSLDGPTNAKVQPVVRIDPNRVAPPIKAWSGGSIKKSYLRKASNRKQNRSKRKQRSKRRQRSKRTRRYRKKKIM